MTIPHPVVVPPMRADPHTQLRGRDGREGEGKGKGGEGTSATPPQRRLLNNPPVRLAGWPVAAGAPDADAEKQEGREGKGGEGAMLI